MAALKSVGSLFDGVPGLIAALDEQRVSRCDLLQRKSRLCGDRLAGDRNPALLFAPCLRWRTSRQSMAVSSILCDWECDLAVMVGDRVHDREAAEERPALYRRGVWIRRRRTERRHLSCGAAGRSDAPAGYHRTKRAMTFVFLFPREQFFITHVEQRRSAVPYRTDLQTHINSNKSNHFSIVA